MLIQAPPFVGREGDVQFLAQTLAHAEEGTGTLILISGEAGIGKTRLCNEVRRLHRDRRGLALLGRASFNEASVPFGAISDALRSARRLEPALWKAIQGRELLWQLAPEAAIDLQRPPRTADRPVLFETLLDAIDEAAGDRTTLWVLDDVHWADDSSWEFVGYASRRLGDLAMVLVVTYRDEDIGPAHPRWADLVRLKRAPAVKSLRLERLTRNDASRLLEALAPELPGEVAANILQRGAGTPLLMEELASLASRSSRVPSVPDIVRATVHERASRLSPESKSLLELAAVAGQDIDGKLLGALNASGSLDDLVTAGLLEQDEDRYRFRHPLLQEAAYELARDRRSDLHERVAAALAGQHHPSELVATHLERAGRPQAGLATLERGAAEATGAAHLDRAATLQLAALALTRRHSSLASRRADLEQAAIRDLFAAGRWSELDPLVRSAWSSRDTVSPVTRTWLAGVYSTHLNWTGKIRESWAVIQQELACLDPGAATAEAALFLSQAGLGAWLVGELDTALQVLQRAADIARSRGDLPLELRARCVHIMATFFRERQRAVALRQLHEIAAIASSHRLPVLVSLAHLYVATLTASLEDVQRARLATEETGGWYASLTVLQEASVHLMEGRRRESETALGRVQTELRLGAPTVRAWADATEAFILLHRGDLEEARRLLYGPTAASEAVSLESYAALWSAARGWLAWEEARWQEAATHLGRAGKQQGFETGLIMNSDSVAPLVVPLWVDALLRLGRTEDARVVMSGDPKKPPDNRFGRAAFAAARFRIEGTPERAMEADALAAAAPWPWLQATIGCWRGELCNDVYAAEAARRQFESIGALRAVQRTETVLRRLGARITRRDNASDALSAREIEVAELVAQGLTNPAIARRLFLSRATVATHIVHILTKLSFSSRAQIAAWVAERRKPTD